MTVAVSTRRRNPYSNLAGARLPSATSTAVGIADPAEGRRVARCAVCGMPATADNQLLDGIWAKGTFRMRLVLCARELPPFDPQSGDPLRVDEVA